MAEEGYFHRGLGRRLLTKSSTNLLKRVVVEGMFAASRNSPHVHPSRWGADFIGMPTNAYVTALMGIGTKGVLKEEGGRETWVWGVVLVRLARKVAATTGSEFVPY